jgi:hypothetical protein
MAARKSGDAIEITRAELDSAVVTAAVERAKEAAQVPLRREVGAADLTKGFNTGAQVLKTAGLAAIGAIIYVIIYEVFFSNVACYTDECVLQHTAVSTALGTAVMAFLIAALQGFEEESAEKVLRIGGAAVIGALIGGAITGAIGQAIYTDLQDSINYNGFDLIRAGAWSLQYLAVGVAVGIAFKSLQKTINGILGGAVGGFIGGGIFNIIYNATATSDSDTGTVSRLIGFTVVGVLVGAGIGLADAVRKNLWLQIATGGMAGKQFIVYQQNAVLGSSSSADITLIKDPEIAGMHVRLNQKSGGTTFEVLDGASDVLLNGEAARSGKLSDGVLLQVGGTVLQFGEKNVEMPTIA